MSYRSVATNAEEEDHVHDGEVLAVAPPAHVPPRFHPALLAWRKASAACADSPDDVIIGADTIVVLDGDVLNKPASAEEAREMLRRLSGRTHRVYTGLCAQRARPPEAQDDSQLRWSLIGDRWSALDLVASDVTIAELDDAAIADYVATGEPLDKAGAYGIQGLGGRLVRRVAGSYTNVVGLPLASVHRLLAESGFRDLNDPTDAYHHWLEAQGKEPLPCPPTSP